VASRSTKGGRGRRALSPPAAMQPQPLLRVLAHPAFHHVGDCLHGGFDVDAAVGSARRAIGSVRSSSSR